MKVREKDLLGRRALAQALADKLYDHVTGPKEIDPGPTVVTIEGPWGSGKSTLLDLVRESLPPPRTTELTPPRLTVRQASTMLRNGEPDQAGVCPPGRTRGVVTAWFNPWAHQSGEQVWAGLVAEIIEAARPVLYPSESARERYWFARNLTRVDRYALRRTLHRRMLAPSLTLGALGVVASLAIAVAELETVIDFAGLRIPTAIAALVIALTFLLLGAVHTGMRYARAAAVRFLPGELFHGPVSVSPDVDAPEPGLAEGLSDPLRRARAGSLYLYQHDVSELVADLDSAGYELIVFVDDLDRCRALTTAEVFEAINLFLAGFVAERPRTGHHRPGEPGGSLRARFVIGLDPVVVASHLDRVYADLYDPDTDHDDDDPSRGWAFLRKLVHLPVMVPQIPDSEMFRIVDLITGMRPESPAVQAPEVNRRDFKPLRDPRLQALIHQRLASQPDRSIREAMRQLNLWDFYERVFAATEPLDDEEAARTRSQHIIILAEIVARWPALQRFLHRRGTTRTGLQRLAVAASAATGDTDTTWTNAAATVLAGREVSDETLTALRKLLRDHQGIAVADLATQVL
jgi:hypothetical protein